MAPSDDQSWHPATFRERGVAVPFTSPQLAGARVRLVERRCDLIVPHPGGARGVYIFALGSLSEFCAPSLHDQALAARLAALGVPTPGGVRAAAQAVAAEGTAGRPAAAAAAAAAAADARMRAGFEAMLLDRPAASQLADVAGATRRAVQRLAERLGGAPEAVQADIARLTAMLTDAGLCAEGAGSGRCALLLDAMEACAAEIRGWMSKSGEQPAGLQVAAAAEALASAGRLVRAAAQKPLQDPPSLLAAWTASTEAVSIRAGRPAMLLDGWEHLCLLWRVAESDGARADALAEAAVLLPPVPPEAEAWFAAMPHLQVRLRARCAAGAMPRAGSRMPSQVVSLMARNEQIRALAA